MQKIIITLLLITIASCSSSGQVKEHVTPGATKGFTWEGDSSGHPFPKTIVMPDFPRKAASNGIEGVCEVTYTVLPNGTTIEHKIKLCSPEGYFERAALRAAKKIKYGTTPSEPIKGVEYRFKWDIAR